MRFLAFTLLLNILLVNVGLPVRAYSIAAPWRLISDLVLQETNQTYYVSPQGSDNNSGRSTAEAWRTIDRVNSADFEPGSIILFQGGEIFTGNLLLDELDCRGGAVSAPTIISSYGEGWATISAGYNYAISVQNCDHIKVSDLILVGKDAGNNQIGLDIVNRLPGDIVLTGVTLDNLEVSGFGHGIRVRAANGLSGFRDVQITNNHVHHNLRSGIATSWDTIDYSQVAWPFRQIYVAHNRVNDISGDPNETAAHTGNGIVIGSAEDVIIEHNVAHDNGRLNFAKSFGPIGIWAWDCKDTVVQFNESYDNRSSSSVDGGGFDLDGGCRDSVMQYNYSHGNDGAGFMVGQFPGAREMKNITVRYNLSVNDARRNNYGGLHLFTGPQTTLQDADIYQNTVFVSPGRNSAATFGISNWYAGLQGVRVLNNSFITVGGAEMIDIPQSGNEIYFWGNNYDSSGDDFVVEYERRTYDSLAEWREVTGQEVLEDLNTGSAVPAGVLQPGGNTPFDYVLGEESALIDAGLDLSALFGLDPGSRDFFGNDVPSRATYDIGMYELPDPVFTIFVPVAGLGTARIAD